MDTCLTLSSICSSSESEDTIEDLKPKNTELNPSLQRQKLIWRIDQFEHLNEQDKVILKETLGNSIPAMKLFELLQLPSFRRTKTQEQQLVDIIQQIKFFKEAKSLKKAHFYEIAKTLSVDNIKKGETVFEYNSEAKSFFIILKGSVVVEIPNPLIKNWKEKQQRYQFVKRWYNSVFAQRKTTIVKNNQALGGCASHIDKTVGHIVKHHIKRMSMRPQDHLNQSILHGLTKANIVERIGSLTYDVMKKKRHIHDHHEHDHDHEIINNYQLEKQLQLTEDEMNMINEHHEFQKVQWFVEAVILTEGHSFGELALIDNKPRRATIKCLEDCIFAKFSKTQYKKIFKEIEKQERIKIINFFQKLPYLSHWSLKAIENLTINFRQIQCIKNQIIYKQNDDVDQVYIVESGEFEIVRQRKLHRKVELNYKQLIGPVQSEKFLKVNPRHKPITMNFALTVFGTCQMFGHEDIIRGKEQRSTQVTCKSLTGVVYVISAQQFIARFIKDDKTWSCLQKNAELNDKQYIQRLTLNSRMRKNENIQRFKSPRVTTVNNNDEHQKSQRVNSLMNSKIFSDRSPQKSSYTLSQKTINFKTSLTNFNNDQINFYQNNIDLQNQPLQKLTSQSKSQQNFFIRSSRSSQTNFDLRKVSSQIGPRQSTQESKSQFMSSRISSVYPYNNNAFKSDENLSETVKMLSRFKEKKNGVMEIQPLARLITEKGKKIRK